MTTNQHPIETGFTAADTAVDVLAGIDLTGKNAIVTAGHTGLGLEMTRALSGAGATVTVAARNPDRAAEAVAGIDRVEARRLDLSDPSSIDAFVDVYLDSGRALHILINSGGIMGGPLVRDDRGLESHFAINHLGHFQLTTGLFPALRAARGARVVTLTSGAQRLTDIHWDDPQFTGGGYDGHIAYGQSKTANVLFAVELDRRWSGDGIRGYAVHPGIIGTTGLGPVRAEGTAASGGVPAEVLRAQGIVDAAGNPVVDPEKGLKTAQQGASTAVFAATSPKLADIGGVYLRDNDIARINPDPIPTEFDGPPNADVAPHAIDPESAERLWALSEELLNA